MTGEQFAALLAGLRVDRPLQEISHLSGLSRMHLWRISTGQVQNPTWDTVQRLQKINRHVTPRLPKKR